MEKKSNLLKNKTLSRYFNGKSCRYIFLWNSYPSSRWETSIATFKNSEQTRFFIEHFSILRNKYKYDGWEDATRSQVITAIGRDKERKRKSGLKDEIEVKAEMIFWVKIKSMGQGALGFETLVDISACMISPIPQDLMYDMVAEASAQLKSVHCLLPSIHCFLGYIAPGYAILFFISCTVCYRHSIVSATTSFLLLSFSLSLFLSLSLSLSLSLQLTDLHWRTAILPVGCTQDTYFELYTDETFRNSDHHHTPVFSYFAFISIYSSYIHRESHILSFLKVLVYFRSKK